MIRPWVAIQRNPASGDGQKRQFVYDLAKAFPQHGLSAHIFSERGAISEKLSDPEWRDSLVGIVAAGGDGTLGAVANDVPGIPVCPFPLGTENLLAKYLGISLDTEAAARIVAAGNLRKFDVGHAGSGTKFLIMGSVGFDAEVIRRLHESRRGNISHLSYVSPILKSAVQYSFPELTVTANGLPEPVVGSLVIVSNFPAYAFKLPVNPDAEPDDGLLTVRVFQKPGRWNFAKYSAMVTRRLHLDRPDVRVFKTSEVMIESAGAAPVQIDGDPFGSTSVTFNCLPGELELFVPESFS